MPSLLDQRLRLTVVTTPLLAALLLSTFAGCASKANKWKFSSWNVKKAVGLQPEEPEPVTPNHMVATWTDTTLSTAGKKPMRGFGGKLMFFDKASEDPVRVEGNLVIYAFDETDRPDHETHPSRKFIFPVEEFVLHESKSTLGPAYSFWLPWDEIGGQQRHISLIAKFEPKEGSVVIGEQTRHLLPGLTFDPNAGKPLLTKAVQTDRGEQIRLATYSGQAAAAVAPVAEESSIVVPPQKQMSTATIPLPKRLGEATAAENTTTFDTRTSATPLSQLSKMKSEPPGQAQAAASQVMQASAMMPVAPAAPAGGAARVTTASERRAMIEAAKASAAPAAPGSLRDSLLGTLPARARQAGR
jgi:hypothetical protein